MRTPGSRLLRLGLIAAVLLAGHASASPNGCTVLLCLSNPAGPMAVAECVPPIRQLWRDLARGRPFPSCEEANGGAVGGLVTEQYDPCPTGSTALPAGAFAAAANTDDPQRDTSTLQRFFVGIGEGGDADNALMTSSESPGTAPRPKVCVVGEPVGVGLAVITTGDTSMTAEIPIYAAIRLLEQQPPRIRVIVNGQVYATVPIQRQ